MLPDGVTYGRPAQAGRLLLRLAADAQSRIVGHGATPVAALLALLLFPGCRSLAGAPSPERYEFHELHMGTRCSITLYAPNGSLATNAARAAFARVAALDRALTDYTDDSELVRLFKAPPRAPHPVSAELFEVLQRAQTISRLTDGAFDVTIGPLVQLWRRARRQRELPGSDALALARPAVGHEKLQLDSRNRTVTLAADGMRLDLGGIAKGYAADQALAVLRQHAIRRAMVAVAGDIAVGAPPPGRDGWHLGIASVDARGGEFTRIVSLRHAAISTSGDTEQFVEINGRRYSHIVDPHTGIGLTNRLGVTVVARDAATTDALATAVSVLGAARGLALIERQPRAAALIVQLDAAGGKKLVESSRFSKVAPTVNPTSTRSTP